MPRPTSRDTLAANLERLMAASADLSSNSALGKRAGVAHSHIGRMRRAESSATTDMLDALAAAFDVEPWELLVDSDATRERAIRKALGKK